MPYEKEILDRLSNQRRLRQSPDPTQKDFGIKYGVTENYIYMLEHKLRTQYDTLKLLFDCMEREAKAASPTKRKQ